MRRSADRRVALCRGLRTMGYGRLPVIWLLGLALSAPAGAFEFKICSLVQAQAPGWKEIPAAAVIDRGRLSFKKKVFLESTPTIPVWSPTLKRALEEALRGLSPAERKRTRPVLDAIGAWVEGNLREEPENLVCPGAWRSAPQVVKAGGGNRFEVARAIVGMLRAAGIPARPTFNGVPLFYLYVTPPGRSGFWTVWDPVHPSGSFRRLPVLWLPLRAGEVELIRTEPKGLACALTIEGRRFAGRDAAARSFGVLRDTGRFPEEPAEPLRADTENWWEVWAVGVRPTDERAARPFSATAALPFVKEISYGARDQAVWVSDPARLKRASSPHGRTDQVLGGLVLTMDIRFSAASGS